MYMFCLDVRYLNPSWYAYYRIIIHKMHIAVVVVSLLFSYKMHIITQNPKFYDNFSILFRLILSFWRLKQKMNILCGRSKYKETNRENELTQSVEYNMRFWLITLYRRLSVSALKRTNSVLFSSEFILTVGKFLITFIWLKIDEKVNNIIFR